MPSHSPLKLPTTTRSTAAKRRLTQSFCLFGSWPLTAGAMKSPVASHVVAIQKSPSCVCQVRATE